MRQHNGDIQISPSEYELTAIRASGPGGQHVNKAATAIQLRFDIRQSSLPAHIQQRLLQYPDQRISQEGVIVIKVDTHRSQQKNREEAVHRLHALLRKATAKRKKRIATRPSKSTREKRIRQKKHRGQIKKWRGKVDGGD
jgi:ribosome-associated protein